MAVFLGMDNNSNALEEPLLVDVQGSSEFETAPELSDNTATSDAQAIVQALANLTRPSESGSETKSAAPMPTSGRASFAGPGNGQNNDGTLWKSLYNQEARDFMRLLRNTDTGNSIERAYLDGVQVTILAPTNDAMAAMPNDAARKFSNADQAGAREQFARAHVLLNADQRTAEARMSMNNFSSPVGLATLNSSFHAAAHGPAGVEGAAYDDAMHFSSTSSEGIRESEADVMGVFKRPNGHKLFLLSKSLMNM